VTSTFHSNHTKQNISSCKLVPLRHISDEKKSQAPFLNLQKALLLNNLLSTTLDSSSLTSHSYMHSHLPDQATYSNPLDLIKQLVKASTCGLSKIAIKFEPWVPAYAPYADYGLETDVSYYIPENSDRSKDIESLNAHLGIRGKLERVVPADVEECWVWDGLGVLWWREHPEVGEEREWWMG